MPISIVVNDGRDRHLFLYLGFYIYMFLFFFSFFWYSTGGVSSNERRRYCKQKQKKCIKRMLM